MEYPFGRKTFYVRRIVYLLSVFINTFIALVNRGELM